MMNENNPFENEITELNEEALEQVSGGKTTKITCIVEKANVRSGPGKEFAVIGHLYEHEKVDFKGETKKDKEGKTWICVNKGTKFGWIRKDLVKK